MGRERRGGRVKTECGKRELEGRKGVDGKKGVEGRGIRIYDGYPGRNRMQFIAATKK